jgi:hydroxymethylglutaryl-CoA synthase
LADPTRETGIEAIAVHVPRHFLDLGSLARANGVDLGKYYLGLGGRRMAVPTPEEDAVALAARATLTLFDRFAIDPATIGLVIVGTETGVDGAKPIASWVHRLAGLPSDCRTYDVQHACYAGTAALRSAAAWLLTWAPPGRKALVVSTDIARYEIGSAGEPTQGAAAVAMIVGTEPRVLRLVPHPEAVFTRDVMDFWRPTYRSCALTDGHYSIRCYLEALEGCWEAFHRSTGLDADAFAHLIYHVPFPKMALKAHRRLRALSGADPADAKTEEADYHRRVLPGLWANAEVGNAYSASVYLSLIGLLEHAERDVAGRTIGVFSYGSGSCAEFLALEAGPDATAWRGRTGLRESLERRREIDHEAYVRMRKASEERARDGSFRVPDGEPGPAFCGILDHQRIYRDAAGAIVMPRGISDERASGDRGGA